MAHIDGLTGQEFATEAEYLDHVSEVTGYTPRDPEHFGERFILQQKKALQRTGSLTPELEAEIDSHLDSAVQDDVDHKIDAQINSTIAP